MKRFALLLVPVLFAASLIAPAPASALTIMWRVQYGNGYTSNPPNVWSNRSPTWDTGGDPHLKFQTDGNLVDYGSFCTAGVCWKTNTAGICGPSHAIWQGDGNFVIYDCNGVARYATNTYYNGVNFVLMTLWGNGCVTEHFYNDVGNYWQLWWANSANSACQIQI